MSGNPESLLSCEPVAILIRLVVPSPYSPCLSVQFLTKHFCIEILLPCEWWKDRVAPPYVVAVIFTS